MKYKISLGYDGTHYCGWAIQPNGTSIQGLVQTALSTVLRINISIVGAGRTDAGVHAKLQVAHFSCSKKFDLPALHYSLNGILPKDIRIYEILPVDEHFHARFSVKKKVYRYYLSTTQDPFNYRYTHFIHTPLNLDLLKKAFPFLLGTHDFSAFAASGCNAKNPIKTLHSLEISSQEQELCIQFEGDGFLYKMVRNLTGTLLEIATHKRPLEDLPKILASKDRTQAGPTAPAHGLFLHHIEYS